jgi:hypothetical protein
MIGEKFFDQRRLFALSDVYCEIRYEPRGSKLGNLASGTPQSLLIKPREDDGGRLWHFGKLLLSDFQPRIARREIVVPCGAAALGLLGHIAEPKHRFIFVYVMNRGAPEPHEFPEISR